MIWLVWRQHRGELLGALVVLAGLGLLLLLHGIPMHEAYDRDGVAACQETLNSGADAGPSDPCVDTVTAFDDTYGVLPQQFTTWLPLTPALVGLLIGAPLLAREYEQGTWQLAWTQSVTRTRWLGTKLAVVLGGVLAASVLFAAGLSWWIGPTGLQQFTSYKFNHSVLVFPAYVLVAVAIGVLAGAVVRRTVVAAAIAVGGYLAVRLPVEFLLRPHYRTPLTTDDPDVLADGWPITDATVSGPAVAEGGPTSDAPAPVRFDEVVSYHPADRYGDFQLIETAILLGITVVLLLITWRLVLGRRAPSPKAEEPELVSAE